MVSSNGAQSLDPLRTILDNNNSTNAQYFNEFLINQVNDGVDQAAVFQNPSRSFPLINDHYARPRQSSSPIEDFLARSSAVVKSPPLEDQWLLHCQMSAAQENHQVVTCTAECGGVAKLEKAESFGEVGVGDEENRSVMIGCCAAPTPEPDPAAAEAEKRRRYSEELREKSIERRQKRMIKNRESAARSRARKQAHTNHLEQKLGGLREMNEWLKLKKEVETQIMATRTTKPNKAQAQLRRTNSANF